MLVGGAVEGPPLASPPSSPEPGACYIVAPGATGAWTGYDQSLAAWTSGGWRFIAPIEGMVLYDRASACSVAYREGSWETGILRGASLLVSGQQVVGPRASAIQSPAGGAVVDSEVRTTVDAILDAMRQHGLIDS